MAYKTFQTESADRRRIIIATTKVARPEKNIRTSTEGFSPLSLMLSISVKKIILMEGNFSATLVWYFACCPSHSTQHTNLAMAAFRHFKSNMLCVTSAGLSYSCHHRMQEFQPFRYGTNLSKQERVSVSTRHQLVFDN